MPDPSIFTSIINSYLPEPQASLLNGILFGVDLKTSKGFYEELKRVGLLHLVVLSGMNITLLSAIIGSLTVGLGKRTSVIITGIMIVMFVIFVGAEPPIVRAAVMGLLSLLAIIYGRRASALYGLLLAVLFIAIFKVEWLSTISFQLSFGATLGIIIFGPKNTAKIGNSPIERIKLDIKRELQTTLSAQVFTAPLIFWYFRQISLISPIANVLVSWLIGPLMIFGFITSILGSIHTALGILPSMLTYGLLTYVVFVVEKLSNLPWTFLSF